ncbi:MAG: carboxypeptidase-like regulatory domain-containing protein [Candidatus Edwardsbacteria bacterium]|nr:carboxypeptidase-like regulatory domain-containing protein [Candidatus Edwardsbacteria bacterium]MBU1576141.1 carboxypeptidase-like regulatory domain-containing protein [Candidatus Edwardsbacteria bacterium]MBU2464227.1 carboxypeptidase-like regulatory domain-containing protein [Candidatus Edwardsbacteria bacterium]MBU2593181.1 carboxypeptidase-like regulatory domain-containing protein [Candidatus Edwardsbacteria bacterium]
MKKIFTFCFIVSTIAFSPVIAGADSTGYFTGYVIDAKTKEPMVGAVVQIIGTKMGANTNMDGRFVIVDVPMGIYSLEIRTMLYYTKTVKDVKPTMLALKDSLIPDTLTGCVKNINVDKEVISQRKRYFAIKVTNQSGRLDTITVWPFNKDDMEKWVKAWNHSPTPRIKNPDETQTIRTWNEKEIKRMPGN